MTTASSFKFANGDKVEITGTPLKGTVRGRSDYLDFTQNQYSVRHIDGQGNPVETWFTEDQICGPV